jgi:hypothetical protein
MKDWRSIDYKKRLEKESKILERSPISKENKRLILRYRNWRLANGVSIPRVLREVITLRVLCERFDVDLPRTNLPVNYPEIRACWSSR